MYWGLHRVVFSSNTNYANQLTVEYYVACSPVYGERLRSNGFDGNKGVGILAVNKSAEKKINRRNVMDDGSYKLSLWYMGFMVVCLSDGE